MTEISERYRRLSTNFARVLQEVPAERWTAQSPCDEWDGLGVARHIVEVHGMFEKLAGRPIEVPNVDGGPTEAFDEVRSLMQADLDDPVRAGAEWDGFFGRTSFEDAVDRFVAFDLIVHAWDLATAAGLNEQIPDAELDRLEDDIAYFGENLAGVVGPPVEVGAEADRQTRILAKLGRNA